MLSKKFLIINMPINLGEFHFAATMAVSWRFHLWSGCQVGIWLNWVSKLSGKAYIVGR